MNSSSKIERFIRGYKTVSIFVLNTIVILLILNFFAWILLKRSSTEYRAEDFRNRQKLYPNYTLDDIALLMRESWNEPFQYEPWVIFKEKPRTGKFVNISKEGFRYLQKRKASLNDDGMKIYVFGGSTTFGYGVADEFTIPAYLQKRITNLYPDKNIHVFNFGRAYYYSTFESALLQKLIREGHSPDLAIFIDGWNESLKVPYFTDELSYLFDAYNYSPEKLDKLALGQVPLVRFLRKKFEHFRSKNQTTKSTLGHRNPIDIRNEYLQNRDTINFLASKYNFSAYFFIHPVPGYRNSYAKHKLWKDRRAANVKAMNDKMQLLDETVNDTNAFSMTALLENYSGQPFIDEIHFTPEVCDLIAEFISQKIRLEPQKARLSDRVDRPAVPGRARVVQ